MDLRDIATLFGIIIAVVFALWLFTFLEEKSSAPALADGSFDLKNFGSAGGAGYAIFSYTGPGHITLLSYEEKPRSKILIIRERGVATESFDLFVEKVNTLNSSGMGVSVISPFSRQRDGIILVPSGAMPYYIINELEAENSNLLVYYIGKKDLVINNSIKKENWYASLSERAKSRLYVIETTLDDFMAMGDYSFLANLEENSWIVKGRKEASYPLAENITLETISMKAENASFLKIISNFGNVAGINDSAKLERFGTMEVGKPVFPGEIATITFQLNETNGSAYLLARKNGEIVSEEKLQHNSEENVFLKRMQFSEPGDYVLSVSDNGGIILSGLVHVKELGVKFMGAQGRRYLFNVTIDRVAVDGEKVIASLNNSTRKEGYFVYSGVLEVPAKLEKGINVFHLEFMGAQRTVQVANNFEGIADVYIKYGAPGLFLVLIVYVVARFNRKPFYLIRITEGAREARKDLRISKENIVQAFAYARKDLGIYGPITTNEFSTALKNHFTDGADVAEGNVEEILKKLETAHAIQSHAGYYQIYGEGDAVKNVLRRIVKEKLIQHGLSFIEKKGRFVTKDFEICVEGEIPRERAIIVFDDEKAIKSYYSLLPENERASLRIKEHNGAAKIVTVEQLDELL